VNSFLLKNIFLFLKSNCQLQHDMYVMYVCAHNMYVYHYQRETGFDTLICALEGIINNSVLVLNKLPGKWSTVARSS